jgi:hypothetical protein
MLNRVASVLNAIGEYSAAHGGPDWFLDSGYRGRTFVDWWQDGSARYVIVGGWRLTVG